MDRSEYPWLYRAADRASGKAQHSHFVALRIQLAIFFVVALLAAFPGWFVLGPIWQKGIATASVIVLAAGLIIVAASRERRYDKRWFDARAVAESAKTLTWRYMMRVPPSFISEGDVADRKLIGELQA